MNKGEQVENMKFWVNILFEWPQSLLAATKIYILLFNLTHSLISLIGHSIFPNGKYFSQFTDKFLKFQGMEYLNHLFKVWNVTILFYVNSPSYFQWSLDLDISFPNSSIDSTLGFWNLGLGLCILPSFSQFIKEMGN